MLLCLIVWRNSARLLKAFIGLPCGLNFFICPLTERLSISLGGKLMGFCIRPSVCRLSDTPFPLCVFAVIRKNQRSTSFFIALLPRVEYWLDHSQLFLAAPLAPSITLRHFRFGFIYDELIVVPRVFIYLIFVLKYCIWFQRNDVIFNSIAPSAFGPLARVKARVRFHLTLFFKRFGALSVDAVIFFVSPVQMVLFVQVGAPPSLSACKYL